MNKRSVALSLLKFFTLTVALTSLSIASATYLRDAVGVGSRGQGEAPYHLTNKYSTSGTLQLRSTTFPFSLQIMISKAC